MDVRLMNADIVIAATAHNPSILSPDWLKETKLISDEPTNFIHTPDLSVFESNKLSLIVDRQRMRLLAKKFDMESLEAIKKIAISYIDLLPNIPYKAYGANFIWLIKANAGESIPGIHIKINESNSIGDVLSGHELSYGCIIKAKRSPYLLKLILEPLERNSLSINFNYHHEIGKEKENLVEYIKNYINLLSYSQNIVDSITKGGQSK